MISCGEMQPAVQVSFGRAFRAGLAAAAVSLALSAGLALAFLAAHGWGTRPSGWTPQQSILEIAADFGGLGARGLPAALFAITASTLIAGGLVGGRARRFAGSGRARSVKTVLLALGAYLGVAFVVAAAPGTIAAAQDTGAVWALPVLGLYGVFGAVVLLPLTAVPVALGGTLLANWTSPRRTGTKDRTPLATKLMAGAALALTAALGTYSAMRYALREWDVQRSDGATCTVMAGMPRPAVRRACGHPTDTGVQPKRMDLVFRPPFTEPCSAGVDVFGNSRVDYDCEGKVSRVGQVNAEGYMRAPDTFEPGPAPERAR